jgi:TRAP-type C4-dicarboxylate transport system substrate-binding protein
LEEKKLKKKMFLAFTLTIVMLFAFAACGEKDNGSTPRDGSSTPGDSAPATPTGETGEVVELTLAYPSAPDAATGPVYEDFAKTVNEQSGGSIHITTFPSDTLVASQEALDAVRNGQADMAHMMVATASGSIPALTPLEVPGSYPGDRFMELYEGTLPILQEIFEKSGVRYLSTLDQGTMTFISSKKQIKTPDDLNGLSIRTSGKWAAEAMQKWGGAPVTVALGDVSTALERGTVDGGYCGWVIVGPFGFYEFADNISYTTLQAEFAGLVMNPASWEKLNDEQKAVIESASKRFAEFSNDLSKENYEKIYKQLEDNGNSIYELTDEENKQFADLTKPLIEDALAVAGEDGQKLNDFLDTLR